MTKVQNRQAISDHAYKQQYLKDTRETSFDPNREASQKPSDMGRFPNESARKSFVEALKKRNSLI